MVDENFSDNLLRAIVAHFAFADRDDRRTRDVFEKLLFPWREREGDC